MVMAELEKNPPKAAKRPPFPVRVPKGNGSGNGSGGK
jgi:hypothetical protein